MVKEEKLKSFKFFLALNLLAIGIVLISKSLEYRRFFVAVIGAICWSLGATFFVQTKFEIEEEKGGKTKDGMGSKEKRSKE